MQPWSLQCVHYHWYWCQAGADLVGQVNQFKMEELSLARKFCFLDLNSVAASAE